MKYEPLVTINDEKELKMEKKEKLDLVDCCPKKVFGYNEK